MSTPRRYSDPPGFWTFFLAVLAALVVYDLVRVAAAAAGVAVLVASLTGGNDRPDTTPGHLPARPDARIEAQAPMATPEALPVWNGPVTALRQSDSRACINGRVADRLDNGWRQRYDERCQQASP